jgi:hypothetical protein
LRARTNSTVGGLEGDGAPGREPTLRSGSAGASVELVGGGFRRRHEVIKNYAADEVVTKK